MVGAVTARRPPSAQVADRDLRHRSGGSAHSRAVAADASWGTLWPWPERSLKLSALPPVWPPPCSTRRASCPRRCPGLPVRVIGLAMQQAMKVQQQYAGFVARGDELFTGLRGEDEPGLATFDDDVDEPTVPPRRLPRLRLRPRRPPTYREPRRPTPRSPSRPTTPPPTPSRRGRRAADRSRRQQSIEELAEAPRPPQAILDEIAIDELVDQAPTLEETAPDPPTPTPPPRPPTPRRRSRRRRSRPPSTPRAAADRRAPRRRGTPGRAETSPPTRLRATDRGRPPTPADGRRSAHRRRRRPPRPRRAPTTPPSPRRGGRRRGERRRPPPTTPQGGSELVRLAGRRHRADRRLRQLLHRPAARPAARLRAQHRDRTCVAYEEATRAREPYLRMLRNRLEKLEEQAVESSPLAPRGA